MFAFLNAHGSELITKTWEQLYISAIALGLGVLVAVPLGIVLTRFPKTAKVVIGLASMLQTVPSLALLALMIPIFGIGKLPAIVALFIYSLLPILRNTYIGMEDVDPVLIDAAKGMGMTALQSFDKSKCRWRCQSSWPVCAYPPFMSSLGQPSHRTSVLAALGISFSTA